MRNLKPIHAICNRFRSITLSHCTTERGHLVPKCTRSSLNTKPQTNLPNLPGLSNHIHCTDRTKLRWCLTSRSHSLQPYSLHQPSCCLSRYYSLSPRPYKPFRLFLPALFHLIDPITIFAAPLFLPFHRGDQVVTCLGKDTIHFRTIQYLTPSSHLRHTDVFKKSSWTHVFHRIASESHQGCSTTSSACTSRTHISNYHNTHQLCPGNQCPPPLRSVQVCTSS